MMSGLRVFLRDSSARTCQPAEVDLSLSCHYSGLAPCTLNCVSFFLFLEVDPSRKGLPVPRAAAACRLSRGAHGVSAQPCLRW